LYNGDVTGLYVGDPTFSILGIYAVGLTIPIEGTYGLSPSATLGL